MVAKSNATDFAADAADAALMVPVSTLASAFDLTPRRVQQLAADGIIPKAERGRYPLIAAVRAYLDHIRAVPEIPVGNMDPAQERARKDRALAISAEIKNNIAIGKVVLIDVVISLAVAEFRRMRNKMLGLPTRVAPQAAVLRTASEVQALIAAEVDLILLELSSGPELAAAAQSVSATVDAIEDKED
ncbi:hypothetical protein MKK67_06805 [Methylobacterium sp. J-072]|uniref:hypothetical protein n=1 Tax=Methylobacterium sp. J-072 TaxID=2836651 RepID=UPI001FBB828A|nr:hypothetical protein [Methylobacterium sp. J-072]MCJ2092206.1 hypothetical protein [Methylobacterium sp. J-072]